MLLLFAVFVFFKVFGSLEMTVHVVGKKSKRFGVWSDYGYVHWMKI